MDQPDRYIDGIFNYCDRWCERCRFTARCRVYEMGEARQPGVAPRYPENPAFWPAMARLFEQSSRALRETAAERGIDLDEIDQEAAVTSFERSERRLPKDPLIRAADGYAWKVHAWLKQHESMFDERQEELQDRPGPGLPGDRPPGDALTVSDALDVVGWFHFQIVVKLRRAGSRDFEDEPEDEDDDGFDGDEFEGDGTEHEDNLEDDQGIWGENDWHEDDDWRDVEDWNRETEWSPEKDLEDDDLTEEQLQAIHDRDRDGSAKVALIGIDHSLAAWGLLRRSMPDESETILDFLVQLSRLRHAAEERYPRARDFVRPGFDDGV